VDQVVDELRQTFDKIATVYDAARPGYPDVLFDDLAALAGLGPADSVLEVGCATGQATRGFAERGFRILAVDPGAELIQVARRNLAEFPNVDFATARFEDLPPQHARFKLVAAAQSWHWVPADRSFAKAAEALVPDGVLAVFAHVPVGVTPAPIAAAFEAIQRQHFGTVQPAPETGYLPSGPFAGMFDASGLFGPVTHKSYPWRRSYDASGFAALMQSRSYLQVLPPPKRDALLAAFAEAIAVEGGELELQYETHLYLARRNP
jgi:SAM-dependent methyltransferase